MSSFGIAPETDFVNRNEENLREFVQTYKSLPELWNTKDPAYMNRYRRHAALDKLAVVYDKIKPGADRAEVRKKINILRSNYRKEVRKEIELRSQGLIYHSSGWVYKALSFLYDSEQPSNEIMTPTPIKKEKNFDDDKTEAAVLYQIDEKPTIPHVRIPIVSSFPPPKRPRNTEIAPKRMEKVLAPNQCQPAQTRINLPTVVKLWSEKLSELSPGQRLLAEKAINDVLFEASLGNLHKNSVRINDETSFHNKSMNATNIHSDESSSSFQSS